MKNKDKKGTVTATVVHNEKVPKNIQKMEILAGDAKQFLDDAKSLKSIIDSTLSFAININQKVERLAKVVEVPRDNRAKGKFGDAKAELVDAYCSAKANIGDLLKATKRQAKEFGLVKDGMDRLFKIERKAKKKLQKAKKKLQKAETLECVNCQHLHPKGKCSEVGCECETYYSKADKAKKERKEAKKAAKARSGSGKTISSEEDDD